MTRGVPFKVDLTLGEYVRRLRRQKAMQLQDVARRSGVSTTHLSRLENDNGLPATDTVVKLHRVLGGDLSMLLELRVCHLPPGTSTWNTLEQRLCSYITQNWRGKLLVSYAALVRLIAATTTRSGLTVQCELDTDTSPTGRNVTDAALARINLDRHAFHGHGNDRIRPHARPSGTVMTSQSLRRISAAVSTMPGT